MYNKIKKDQLKHQIVPKSRLGLIVCPFTDWNSSKTKVPMHVPSFVYTTILNYSQYQYYFENPFRFENPEN